MTSTGADSITGPIPDLGNVGTGPVAVGDGTFDSLSGNLFLGTAGVSTSLDVNGWSTLIPGNDIAISGTEDVGIGVSVGGTVSSLGFYVHEPHDRRGTAVGQLQFRDLPGLDLRTRALSRIDPRRRNRVQCTGR